MLDLFCRLRNGELLVVRVLRPVDLQVLRRGRQVLGLDHLLGPVALLHSHPLSTGLGTASQ